ncbi:MAG TPA: hypothetical protein VGP28_01785 [Methylocella sp.]|jgi:hypothetical protein|nr:hypothetical protein [Methylocella sp.]
MNAISKFLTAVVYTVGFLAIVAMIGFIWLMLLASIGPLALVLIFLAGLAAAIAHNKGKEFLKWLFIGTLFPGIAVIAAIAIRRAPIVVHVTRD